MAALARRLRRSVVLLDGGTGEELMRRGLPDDRRTWSAVALAQPAFRPLLRAVHGAFLAAGARRVTTGNYAVTPGCGFSGEQVDALCAVAGEIARAAVESQRARDAEAAAAAAPREREREREREPLGVLGCLPPLVESYRADLVLPREEGARWYRRIVLALLPHADAFLAETMSSIAEAEQAAAAVAQEGGARPLLVSWTLDGDGRLRSGEAATQAVRAALAWPAVQLEAILFNCCEPEAVDMALSELRADAALVQALREHGVGLGAYANRLTPVPPGWSLAGASQAQPMRR
jgi:S-methylmethionine-dependent homocysteine/selenocysteine methylase